VRQQKLDVIFFCSQINDRRRLILRLCGSPFRTMNGDRRKWHFRAMPISTFRDEKQAKRWTDDFTVCERWPPPNYLPYLPALSGRVWSITVQFKLARLELPQTS
jgi:hypothetical protein